MCNLSQGVWNDGHMKGIAQGLEKGRMEMAIELVTKKMKTMNKNIADIMDFLEIDEALRPEIMKRIDNDK